MAEQCDDPDPLIARIYERKKLKVNHLLINSVVSRLGCPVGVAVQVMFGLHLLQVSQVQGALGQLSCAWGQCAQRIEMESEGECLHGVSMYIRVYTHCSGNP